MKEINKFLKDKLDLINKFSLDQNTSNIIIDFISFLYNKSSFKVEIIDHFFNSFIIITNYDLKNIKVIQELLKILKDPKNKLLSLELAEQLNNFSNYQYDDNYDLVIFDTFDFLKYFFENDNLHASVNIIHEIIYNISRINKNIDSDVKARLYIEILNDVQKKLKERKSNKHIYLSTVETCNITIRLINDWIDKSI